MFDNSYARLPERFFHRQAPARVPAPALVRLNAALAKDLTLDEAWLRSDEGVAMLAGNLVPDDAEPLAMAYAGHQFGGWSPQLGDGRAILLGEVIGTDGQRHDLHLKGAGQTPFSRMGDGRAVLGPVLREYIISEAMAAFGIPTTRALAAVATGDQVYREGWQPGAVLARAARSHVRVGTFEYFAARKDTDALKTLADYVIDRHYPELRGGGAPYRSLFAAVVARQATLIADWMGVGFIHGVMNTDNMSIIGETIDYGPCAFMDQYHPNTVYSSIDHGGRYAFGNQPYIAQWNLSCLARAMLSLLDDEQKTAVAIAQAELDVFPDLFDKAWQAKLRAKLGLNKTGDDDPALANELFALMAERQVDFTNAFRTMSFLSRVAGGNDHQFTQLFGGTPEIDGWLAKWRARLASEQVDDTARQQQMQAVNPAFIPRNHRVEAALVAANSGDFSLFERLLMILATPFAEQPDFVDYQLPPEPEEVVAATFCGT